MARKVIGEKRYLAVIQRQSGPPNDFPFGLMELAPDALSAVRVGVPTARSSEPLLGFDGAGSLAALLLRRRTGKRP